MDLFHDPAPLKSRRACSTVNLHLGVSLVCLGLVTTNILGLTPGEQPIENSHLGAGACARRADQGAVIEQSDAKAPRQLSPAGFSASAAIPSATAAPTVAPGPRVTSSLKLIRTASLQVEVASFRAALEEASRAATAFDGYVSDRQSSEDAAGRVSGQITLRVPSARFDGAMSALKKLGRVRSEGVQTQDVTRAYADLETRLKVKRETATRLREILTRQTGKVSEVLEVERAIARVVEEIEQAEGERLYFDNLVSLSTITLALHEPNSIVTPGAFDPILKALRHSLLTMSQSIAALIELGAGLLPWLVAAYLAFRVVRWRRRPKA